MPTLIPWCGRTAPARTILPLERVLYMVLTKWRTTVLPHVTFRLWNRSYAG